MDLNDILFGTERDRIARASASTYPSGELATRGLQITLNLSNKKTRYVGNPPVYPEIVVWRPDYSGATTGQVVATEAIETVGSLAYPRINEWRILASLLGARFNLVIPASELERIRGIVVANGIKNVYLQTWRQDINTGNYIFNSII